MHHHPTPLTASREAFEDALGRAALSKHNRGDAHTIRGVGRRFLDWSWQAEVDPLHPTRTDISRFLADAHYAQPDKVRWALRSILRSAHLASDEHGLGTGNQSHRLATAEGTALGQVLDEVLASARGRLAVWRSGLNKLLTWAAESGLDPLDLTAPDLDDYLAWVQEVGGAEGELLVIARRFVRTRLRRTMRAA